MECSRWSMDEAFANAMQHSWRLICERRRLRTQDFVGLALSCLLTVQRGCGGCERECPGDCREKIEKSVDAELRHRGRAGQRTEDASRAVDEDEPPADGHDTIAIHSVMGVGDA